MAQKYVVGLADSSKEVEVVDGDREVRARVGGKWYRVVADQISGTCVYDVLVDGRRYEVMAEGRPGGIDLLIGNDAYLATVETERANKWNALAGRQPGQGAGDGAVTAPMTGIIVEVRAQLGQQVEAGEVVLVVEAMKMNNEIRVRRSGAVESIFVQVGERVSQGSVMLTIK